MLPARGHLRRARVRRRRRELPRWPGSHSQPPPPARRTFLDLPGMRETFCVRTVRIGLAVGFQRVVADDWAVAEPRTVRIAADRPQTLGREPVGRNKLRII